MNHYRKIIVYTSALTLLLTLMNTSSLAARSSRAFKNQNRGNEVNHRLGVGLTYHKAHSDFESLPFGDGDLSYGLSYEYHEGIGYWLIGVDFTPSVDDKDQIDHVVTPRLSLIIKDRFYRAGVGILKSYISDKDDLIDDTDIYYQINFGISAPLGNQLCFDINSIYSVEKWRDIDFEFSDIEFNVIINYIF